MVPWGFTLANNLLFKKVHAALGFDRCRIMGTGAAPISKDTLEFFMSLNIPVMEMYGMSECCASHSLSCNQGYRITRSAGKEFTKNSCDLKLLPNILNLER